MKTTNRVHRNGAAKAAKSQVKNPAVPVPFEDTIDLVLFSNNQGTSLAHISLARDEFEAIRINAETRNGSLENVLGIGLKGMTQARRSGTGELDGAANQVSALLQLIEHHIYATRGDETRDDVKHILFECGLNELIQGTRSRLSDAVQALLNASDKPKERQSVRRAA